MGGQAKGEWKGVLLSSFGSLFGGIEEEAGRKGVCVCVCVCTRVHTLRQLCT